MVIDKRLQNSFFSELAKVLRHEDYEIMPVENEVLPIRYNGEQLLSASIAGIRYFREDINYEIKEAARDRAGEIVSNVREYISIMEAAPSLKAAGLDEQYKLLADFGGAVLAGKHSADGVQFVTWSWDYNHSGVTIGHYFGNNYIGAKEDFALRSGLAHKTEEQFTPEQLIEIYRCCADTMRYSDSLTYEQEQRIDDIQSRITELVPDYAERFKAELELDTPQQTM